MQSWDKWRDLLFVDFVRCQSRWNEGWPPIFFGFMDSPEYYKAVKKVRAELLENIAPFNAVECFSIGIFRIVVFSYKT